MRKRTKVPRFKPRIFLSGRNWATFSLPPISLSRSSGGSLFRVRAFFCPSHTFNSLISPVKNSCGGMPLGGRLEKNQSDEKAAQEGSWEPRALRKRATPVVPLSQMARNERLNTATLWAWKIKMTSEMTTEKMISRETNFRPNILFSAATLPR